MIRCEATGGDHAVDMRMMLQPLVPGMEHAEEADLGSLRSRWPGRIWMVRRSAPASSRCVDAGSDIAVAGPELAAHAIRAGLVDEFQMRVCPVVIGGGKRYFPSGVRLDLELIEERRFRNGEIFLRYAVRGQSK
jgi:dihydrofolate reductase